MKPFLSKSFISQVPEQSRTMLNHSEKQSNERPLLGTDEVDARLKVRYRGGNPKRHFTSNLNNFDHNILGLGNRLLKDEGNKHCRKSKEALFESVDKSARMRSKSQNEVMSEQPQQNIDRAGTCTN